MFPWCCLCLLAVAPANPYSQSWYSDILTFIDHEAIDPYRAKFLQQLQDADSRLRSVRKNKQTSEEAKPEIEDVQVSLGNGPPVALEDLG